MLNRDKEEAILHWLGCYSIKVQAVSDLQDGLQLLHLLSYLEPTVSSENVDPNQAFATIEKVLCEFHGFLPAHFLAHRDGAKGKCEHRTDAVLAVTAVLLLSALAFRIDSCSPTSDVGPLYQLNRATQCHIKGLMEIVVSGEEVLDTLQAYLEEGVGEESPPSALQRAKRRKSTSYTASPSARSPLKRLSPSPQQRLHLPMHKMQELKMLREQVRDEEQTNSELREEVAQLKEAVKHKEKQIKGMNERIQGLQAESSEQGDTIATLQGRFEQLQAQNRFLEDKANSFERVRDDYDTVIRQNVSLQSENDKLSGFKQECQALKESLAASTAEISKLASRLTAEEERNTRLSAELGEKTRDLEATLNLYSTNRRPFLGSPGTPSCKLPGSPRISCFQELLMVELQDTNARQQQEITQLQHEVEAATVKLQMETNALKATILQLEQTNANLTAEVSRLGQRCSQLNNQAAGLEAKLHVSKATAVKLESELSAQATEIKDLRLELTSKGEQIAALNIKISSCEALNKELLKSNEQLNAALCSLEAEKAEHLSRLRDVAAENERHQEALSQELAMVCSLNEAACQLRAELRKEGERGKYLHSQLSASQEEKIKLEELVAATRSRLAESISQSARLQEMVSQVEREKDGQLAQLSEAQDKLEHAGCTVEQLRARVQELEALERHLNTLCSELRLQLSEQEDQLKATVEGKEAVVKMMEEVQMAHTALHAKFDLASQQHSEMTISLQQQVDEHKNSTDILRRENQELLEKTTFLESELDQLRICSDCSKLREENGELRSQLAALTQLYKELNSDLCVVNEQYVKKAEECCRLQQSIKCETAEKKALEAHLEQGVKATCELEEKCAEQASLNERLSDEILVLKADVHDAGTEKRRLETDIKEVTDCNSELRIHLQEMKVNRDAAVAEKQMVELKLSEKMAVCATLQDEVSAIRVKLAASEEEGRVLRARNTGLDSFAAACRDKLQAGQAELNNATTQVESMRQEISVLRQAITRLNLEKEFLHSSLSTVENTSRSLNEACVAATRAVDDTKQRLEDSEQNRSHLMAVVEQLRQECASLKIVLLDTSEKLSLREGELASAHIEIEGLAARIKELEDGQAVLKHTNQALEDHVGDLEVKLHNQLQFQKKAEDDYYECVNERDAHKESLKQQIDELTSNVAENVRLQQELAELRRAQNASESAVAKAAAEVTQLRAEKEQLELGLANQTNELQKVTTRCDQLHMKCRILENKNEGLKYELKSATEGLQKRVQSALVSVNEGYNKTIGDLKNKEDALRDEVVAWKDKYQNERALREKREMVLTRHIGDMKEGIEHSSKDIAALKAQLDEQSGQLISIKQERDNLAAQNRSLQAQVSFCDAKLREHEKAATKTGRAPNESIYSTPSLESLWSQRQPSSARQSRSSLTSIDQFKVPTEPWKAGFRRESRSGPLAQAAALDSSIFSESRFSCDDEQDLFMETTLADLTWRGENQMGRYSELYRRNSMVPGHLKSCYPVETQQSTIPATPLKGDGVFAYPAAFVQEEDATKRKRPTQSSSSDEGTSKPSSGTPGNTTPSKPNKGQKTSRTPSSVKKFLKSFKR